MFLLHGFVAQQGCLVLWLSKPAFLGNHQLTRVSHMFSMDTYNHLVGLTV